MPKLTYSTTLDGLEEVEQLRPYKLIDNMPKWFKDMPMDIFGNATARSCPSFVDLFRSAYVFPAWCDMEFTFFPEEDNRWEYAGPSNQFDLSIDHPDQQLLDHIPTQAYAKVIKPSSPWMLKTDPGISILQIQYPFDFQQDFTVWPGVTHNDVYHETNVQMFIHKKDSKEFTVNIKRSQPLALHIPFRREEEPWEAEFDNKGERLLNISHLYSHTKFKNSYRNLTKGFIK